MCVCVCVCVCFPFILHFSAQSNVKPEFCSWSQRMKSANLQTLTQAKFILKDRDTKLASIDTERGWRAPRRQGLQQFYIFTSIKLYIFGWLMTLTYIFFDQSVLSVTKSSLSFLWLFWIPHFSISLDIVMPSLNPFSRPQTII